MLISVVIPTYNRLPILKKCLLALENQILIDEIYDYEIVIIDDGSTDGTVLWLKNNIQNFPHLRLFEQPHGGPALGRNLGVDKSRGDLIVFMSSKMHWVPPAKVSRRTMIAGDILYTSNLFNKGFGYK